MVKIRRAQLSDAGRIRDLHQQSTRGMNTGDLTDEQIDDLVGPRQWQAYETAMIEGEVFHIATEEPGDQLCGFSSFFPHLGGTDVHAELRVIYVLPSHTRRGIGGDLLRAVEADAVAMGIGLIRLQSTANAVEFYTAEGFEIIPRRPDHVSNDVPDQCVPMKKLLS